MKFLQSTSNLFRAAVCALILAVLWDVTAYGAACQTLPDAVLRLHVVAASDSEEDQALKLAVRDEVLEVVASLGAGAQTPFEMQSALCTHLETIQKAAEDVIRQQGHGEAVQVFFVDMTFPDCVYGGFVLPAGKYRALRVVIGEGQGHNWWCMLFPSLCLPEATVAEPEEVFSEAQQEVTDTQQYEVKFLAVEWLKQLMHTLSGVEE